LYHLSRFRNFENKLLNNVEDLVQSCKADCIKNIIIGGKVSDPGKLGYLTCNRIQIYPPPSAIQDTMVAITAKSSGTATCRYIATVKALTKMKDEEDMKRGVHITGTITMEATHHHSKCLHLVNTLMNEKLWDLIALFWISVMGPRGTHCTAQPQLQGASGAVLAARIDGFGGGMFDLIPT
jgi:hypothetical protein